MATRGGKLGRRDAMTRDRESEREEKKGEISWKATLAEVT